MVRRDGEWEIIESASVKQAKEELAATLARKDNLLTEIHHRVKNNLQIVSSLLTIKSSSFTGPDSEAAVADIQARVRAMALVHEQLYRGDRNGEVRFGAYLRQLVTDLAHTWAVDDRIAVRVVEEGSAVPLIDLDTAVPLGLAATEALSNAFKHAFPDERQGTVILTLDSGETELRLMIADDGCGMRADVPRRGGAGLALMRGLTTQAGGVSNWMDKAEPRSR